LTDGNIDYHVAWYDMSPSNSDASLDTDDTSSYGPETITINNLDRNSVYRYYVHDYSHGDDHNDPYFKDSSAKVDVYYADQAKTFYIPNENGNAWKVFEIINGEIIPCTSECIFGVDGSSDSNIGLRDIDKNSNEDTVLFSNLPQKNSK